MRALTFASYVAVGGDENLVPAMVEVDFWRGSMVMVVLSEFIASEDA